MSELNVKIDYKYLYAVLMIIGVAGASAITAPYIGSQEETAPLVEDGNFREADAEDILNVINNMKDGYITTGDARKYIQDEKFYAKQYIDGSAVETEVNLRYITYLNAALGVVTAYGNHGGDSKEFDDMFKIMQEKRELI